MTKKLYVGNLPYSCNDDALRQIFAEFGEVASARVITDRASGRSKGFGFVEMSSDEAADQAIASANQIEIDGRQIHVAEARPEGERSGGGGGRGFGGGGGGGGRGGFRGGGGGRGGGYGGGGGGRRDGNGGGRRFSGGR